MPDKAVFVQVSDLHFRTHLAGQSFDLDVDIRRELVRDAGAIRQRLGQMDGILFCGDVAFSGKKAEYALAKAWLDELSDHVGCSRNLVWTIPGNHDVDRDVLRGSWVQSSIRNELRTCRIAEIDQRLEKVFADSTAAAALLSPFDSYNAFAAAYSCETRRNALRWYFDIPLSEQYSIRLWGLNSCLVSDQNDDEGASQLVLGEMQARCPNDDGIINVAMCHHPLQWLRDKDVAQDALDTRAPLQLFGHKHRQRVREVAQEGRHSLQIHSGAANPDRGEGAWEPRYNILLLKIGADRESLEVDLFGRTWSAAKGSFVADHGGDRGEAQSFRIPLAVRPRRTVDTVGSPGLGQNEPTQHPPINSEAVAESEMLDARRLTYRFLSLPFTLQIEIAQSLGLLRDEDAGQSESELRRRFFSRAIAEERLARLNEEVNRRYEGSQTNEQE